MSEDKVLIEQQAGIIELIDRGHQRFLDCENLIQ